ncbi:glycosyl hydrolase [Hahella sp. KA22]|uniref:glycoside hydrolase family 5 protein n=1 Tax=Hahella sp. KA22 TaxID=1628392 RepID=UPI000FDE7879|nr:cellulase family glycosylhydrolase [Hahella sp. KA22]AZZ93495.1 glycosyl hydrolase [Hahella sp. KA22]QAY56869.1 glycosyl hydrolase [Hahella sp. KA22]
MLRHVVFISLILLSCFTRAETANFWDSPQHGANSFNRLPPTQEYFDALSAYGATWVRLAYDKWPSEGRDFLIGDADHYQSLNEADLAQLKLVLDRAHKANLKVVIAPLSLPNMRWSQNNNDVFDDRIWSDKKHWNDANRFWKDLATALKGHPAIAAFNLVNEPAPERNSDLKEHADSDAMAQWYKKIQGSSCDLRLFYQSLVKTIRQVDQNVPVMLDAGWYAAADAFFYWPSGLEDSNILYSFHMYEPYDFTSSPNINREKRYVYPGDIPFGEKTMQWGPQQVAAYISQPINWAKKSGIPVNRMVMGEFGCARTIPGCGEYLKDVLEAADSLNLHWAFYAFREDSWDQMDYELGTKKVNWKYWDAMEKGEPDPIKRESSALFDIIRKRL